MASFNADERRRREAKATDKKRDKKGNGETASFPEELETFEEFRLACVAEQQRLGFDVPSPAGNPTARFQWEQAARCVYSAKVRSLLNGRGKRGRQSEDKSEGESESEVEECEDPLVTALTEGVRDTIENNSHSFNTMGTKVVEHARMEAFPTSCSEARDLREFLSSAEVLLRVAVAGVRSAALDKAMKRLRDRVASQRKEGKVQFCQDGFPAIAVLLDLYVLDLCLERWNVLRPLSRRKALEAAVALCQAIEGEAVVACVAALEEKRSGDIDGPETALLHDKVRALGSSLPFDFPEECTEVILATLPGYRTTLSRFKFHEVDAATSSRQHTPPTASRSNDSEDLSVGELLRRRQAEPPRVVAAAVSETKATAQHVPRGMRVFSSSSSAPGTALAPVLGVAAPTRRTGIFESGHVQCCSRFHSRYADPAKHASSECRFCATCHLMEILFNGCKADCVWKHWPTKRRIQLHLKRFPQVQATALDRFRRLERGEILGQYNGEV